MAKPNLITTKELIEKIKIDVVNDNITQIIAQDRDWETF